MNVRKKPGGDAVRVQRGVTLIELMVGMAIGLLSVVVITQVMVTAEGQKRSTTSGSDAQINGSLALDTLQREIRSSGYGIANHVPALGCQIVGNRAGTLLAPATSWVLAPVSIVDGATPGAPDTIRVMRSDASTMSLPLKVDSSHLQTGTYFDMANDVRSLVNAGDLMLAIPAEIIPGVNWCSVFSVSSLPTVALPKRLPHATDSGNGAWNAVPSNFPPTGYPNGSVVVNLGRLVNRSYTVAGGELTRTAFLSTTGKFEAAEPLFAQIVNLQAVYGKQVSPGVFQWNVAQPTTEALWQQVFAVRVAVVARSDQRETEEVTLTAPTWTPDGVTPTPILLNADPDWQHYRYKVYETVVPLRNRVWHSMTEDEKSGS